MKRAVIIGAVLLVAAVALGWFLGRPAYRDYKERRAVEQARKFIDEGDFRNASLSARQALLANPKNVDACRMMAGLAELAGSTNAVEWHRRIAETEPTVGNKLRLAAVALRFHPPPFALASEVLGELSASATSTNLPAYQVLSAERALKLQDLNGAVRHFELASRLEPTNELHRLNLAVLNLRSTNELTVAAARAELERLKNSTNLGTVALRWLVAESLKKADLEEARTFSAQLAADPKATLEDRLQLLGILHGMKSPELDAQLRLSQARGSTNAAELYGVCAWMISHGMTNAARQWVTNCPPETLARQPAPMAIVDCLVASQDWEALETFLLEEKWGALDFMRLAFLSRAASEQNQRQAAEIRWRSAIREAGEHLGQLTSLLSMASAWGRDKAREDLLWQIAQRFPRERWALRELERIYTTDGNTLGLNKAFSLLMNYDPENFVAANNFAATSLLLGLNLTRAHEVARQMYLRHPEEAVLASTYAYSLHVQGRTREALEIMSKLKPDELEQPAVALYYGVILTAAGDTSKAARYLAAAQTASLLPEEKALLSRCAR